MTTNYDRIRQMSVEEMALFAHTTLRCGLGVWEIVDWLNRDYKGFASFDIQESKDD